MEILIFSMDRACQLEACLRSIKMHYCYAVRVWVSFRYSSDEFRFGYERLMRLFPDVRFIRQEPFEKSLPMMLDWMRSEHVLLMCDDVVLRKDVNYDAVRVAMRRVHSFNLLLGLNVHWCYAVNRVNWLQGYDVWGC